MVLNSTASVSPARPSRESPSIGAIDYAAVQTSSAAASLSDDAASSKQSSKGSPGVVLGERSGNRTECALLDFAGLIRAVPTGGKGSQRPADAGDGYLDPGLDLVALRRAGGIVQVSDCSAAAKERVTYTVR